MSVRVNKISKFYKNQKALDSVSFEIKKGEIVGFLGPNGAGKSTLMRILTGFIKPSEGEVFIHSVDVSKAPLQAQKQIGYLPEHNPLYKEIYLKEYLSFIAGIHKVPLSQIPLVIEKVGLSSVAHKKIYQLSKGYQQRLGIAAAIVHDPEVLILDEPMTGLDPNQLIEIRDLLKTLGKDKIILFSTHILQEVEAVCDRVLVIKNGCIVADEKLQILKAQQAQIIEVAFDLQIEAPFFKKIPHLSEVNNVFQTTWELTFDTKKDMRPEVFDFATHNGLKILQLHTKNKNLERLFRELTV